MIATDFCALAERLRRRAATLAAARAQQRRATGWWRRAELLWPLFTKG